MGIINSRVRIAIADDNKEFCQILIDYLSKQEEIEIIGVANDGMEAVELVMQKKPDLLLLDIIMPHLDGFGVIKKLKGSREDYEPKIVVISTVGQESIAQKALQLGAEYYMIKPFHSDMLCERILQIANDELKPQRQYLQHECLSALEENCAGSIEGEIAGILHDMGIPPHIKGYLYLSEAIRLVVYKVGLLGGITKELYPKVAITYSTTPSRVERAIRHAIEVSWNKRDSETVELFFGARAHIQRSKPTNSEFIATVAEKLRR
ncbi:stage 0 sporulation protein A [Peptoclostridium acidaminophilum DSM 3953]|uniref:Stage 0 sporulation protein A homolog n=1 Tax=Peptoclostridium acidaminophilum DSM 3953 TaxID=1286171 RepID=W8TFA1_PEPAC|nr:sporulation transcription factor Spo0A [Peptoclostridium acidaminophilum]AHM56503.1 stage 0 sporulation protein A [Peptoclostridium acidaminophilum DSM 3953]